MGGLFGEDSRLGPGAPSYRSIYDPNFQQEVGPGWGWARMIPPDLEQRSVGDSIRFESPIQVPGMATARLARLSIFLCPSDRMPRRRTATRGETWLSMGQVYSSIPICEVAGSNSIGVFGIGEPGVNGRAGCIS